MSQLYHPEDPEGCRRSNNQIQLIMEHRKRISDCIPGLYGDDRYAPELESK